MDHNLSTSANLLFNNLKKPIVFLELHTTGLDINQDKIIRILYIKFTKEGNRTNGKFTLNPGIEISQSVFSRLGYTNEKLSSEETFSSIAFDILTLFNDCDFVGPNILFDILLLKSEFNRAGIDFDYSNRIFINPVDIWHNHVGTGLKEAAQYYSVETNSTDEYSLLNTSFEILVKQIVKHDIQPDMSSLQASSYSKNNILHLAINKYSNRVNSYKLEIAKRELNADINVAVKTANKDLASFLEIIESNNIHISCGDLNAEFESRVSGASILIRYDFFKDHGLDLKPRISSFIAES